MHKRIIVLFIILMMAVPVNAYANYSYTVYAGSVSSSLAMEFRGIRDDHCYITAYYSGYPLGPSPNPVYAPSGMAAGRIVLSYKNNSDYHSSYWNYATIAYIDLYLVNNDGSEVYWQKISFQPWYIAEGNTVVLGDYYLGTNYRGVRIGALTAYCSNYMTASATASERGELNFDFYNLAFAPTEGQFNNLSNNAINAYNAANSANTAATGAKTAANTAATNAASALNAANSANVNAANASNNAWYNGSTYGGSAQSVGNVAGYIAYSQLPTIDSKIDNINTTINNLSGADKTTPIPVLKTVSGAMATSGSSIRAVLDITDSDSTAFTYSLDNMTYSPVPGDKIITLPVSSPGTNVISVWVKDPAGNIGTTSIAIRKL